MTQHHKTEPSQADSPHPAPRNVCPKEESPSSNNFILPAGTGVGSSSYQGLRQHLMIQFVPFKQLWKRRCSQEFQEGYAEFELIQGLIFQTLLPFLNPSGNGKRGENQQGWAFFPLEKAGGGGRFGFAN